MNQLAKTWAISLSKPFLDVVEDFVALKRSINTQKAYRNDIGQFFNTLDVVMLEDLAYIQPSELASRLQKHIEGLKKVETLEDRKRVTNARTVNRKQQALKAFFDYLVTFYKYPLNPLDGLLFLKTENYSNTESLNRAEVVDLLELAKGKHRLREIDFRNYLIALFLFNMALRVEECATLQWTDLDLNGLTAKVYQKGGSTKLLPLPHSLSLLLLEFKTLYGDTCPYIFHPVRNNRTQELDKPLNVRSLFEIVVKLAKAVVPTKNITPHSLRKTFIELSLDMGEDLISICNATGHGSVEMVKYYDTRDRLKNNAVNGLANLI